MLRLVSSLGENRSRCLFFSIHSFIFLLAKESTPDFSISSHDISKLDSEITATETTVFKQSSGTFPPMKIIVLYNKLDTIHIILSYHKT